MGWKDLFRKKKKDDIQTDIQISQLKPGYFLDYDMNTWEVKAYNKYDWGGGDTSDEWHLVSADDDLFLERSVDDDEYFIISRKIPFNQLGGFVRSHLKMNDDPPDEITYENRTYFLEETAGGYFYPGGKNESKELLSWTYEDKTGEHLLGIEQWGDNDFTAWVGSTAEAYQFTNILPI